MDLSDLSSQAGEWLRGSGPMSDVVISSRIRLARNLAGYPFLTRADNDQRRELSDLIRGAITAVKGDGSLSYLDIDKLGEMDRQLLVERHLISKQHAEGEGDRGLALSPGETEAVMVNEEDHLRIQVLRSGLQIEDCWTRIDELDNRLGGELEYAFDSTLGYLTACPTNVGTGMRVSVMLHLPGMRITEELPKMFAAAKELRLAVRGLYGEGTEATGDFYQISNQTTLGRGEQDLLGQFGHEIIPRFVEYEHRAREALCDQKQVMLDDKVHRALGVLRTARQISSEETLYLLSHVRLGVNLGRIRGVPLEVINELFLLTQPAHLQRIRGQKLEEQARRVARAEFVRSRLSASPGQ
ncbi:MAG: Protein-arginine kinase [Phycisphaerae bacterium]|nr:Protein-arginine kinase [Phycisphaerae bacterium]